MTTLAGEVALMALRESFEGKRDPEGFVCSDVPFERLRLGSISHKLSAADKIVRLRHALRYANLTLPNIGGERTLPLPTASGWPNAAQCRAFGLQLRAGGLLEASPWRPTWLPAMPEKGADATPMSEFQRPWQGNPPVADPFIISSLGFECYRGPGQALAVRCALHLPPEKSLLVLLPTGEGKSLVFEALAAANPRTTIAVVVPTVALAINHAEAAERHPTLATGHPRAYVGDRQEHHEVILSRIVNGTQGLLFAAPEAMVQRLREPLVQAARSGNLSAIVIDEAHLVNAWGTDFRAEFQKLAALIAEIREVCVVQRPPKVICLSATVTQQSLDIMEKLFSPGEPISVIPSARLRPEMDIYIAPTAQVESVRQEWVLDALRHLPRPAILYVTKQEDAERWQDLLIQEGFRSLAMVHGGTDTSSRERVVEEWRRGTLDLVVGTSAFGLGIDYPHVRTVVHACLPESLDRYYQEIGRSGRDNRASIAVLVPTVSDFVVARGLAIKKVITIKKALPRWEAMFRCGVCDGKQSLRFTLDPSVAPAYDPDMKSDLNEEWNGRVLNLMALSGFIRLAGLRFDQESGKTRIAVDILHDGHLQMECWQSLVEQTRKSILRGSFLGYQLMAEVVSDRGCPSVLLSKLYQLQHRGKVLQILGACGGCSRCRNGEETWHAQWPSAFPSPWPIGFTSDTVLPLLDNGRCLVKRESDIPHSSREIRRLRETVQRLWDAGIRKCLVVGALPDYLAAVLSERPWCVVVAADDRVLESNGLPPGPEMVWVSPGHDIRRHHLAPRVEGNERIVVLSPRQKDLGNPGSLLSERIPLLPFNTLHDRLIQ